jgi:hypothetical protein
MESNENKIFIDAAVEEILHPTFIMTKMYLEVHEIEFIDGLPKIERIDQSFYDDRVAVYFPIKEEAFFLEIILTKEEPVEVYAVTVESGNRIYLTATSEELNFDELSKIFKLRPVEGWSKGDLRKTGKSINTFSRISFEPLKSSAYGLEHGLNLLLDELEKDIDSVLDLTKQTNAYISVCRHLYVSGNACISLDIELINRLAKLNIGVDIDTYIGGNQLKD